MGERVFFPRAKNERRSVPFIGRVLEDALEEVAGDIGMLL